MKKWTSGCYNKKDAAARDEAPEAGSEEDREWRPRLTPRGGRRGDVQYGISIILGLRQSVMFYWAMRRESAKIWDKEISEDLRLYIWY